MIDEETTTQRLRISTLNKVRAHGRCGESFDAVVNRVFDEFDRHEADAQ